MKKDVDMDGFFAVIRKMQMIIKLKNHVLELHYIIK